MLRLKRLSWVLRDIWFHLKHIGKFLVKSHSQIEWKPETTVSARSIMGSFRGVHAHLFPKRSHNWTRAHSSLRFPLFMKVSYRNSHTSELCSLFSTATSYFQSRIKNKKVRSWQNSDQITRTRINCLAPIKCACHVTMCLRHVA